MARRRFTEEELDALFGDGATGVAASGGPHQSQVEQHQRSVVVPVAEDDVAVAPSRSLRAGASYSPVPSAVPDLGSVVAPEAVSEPADGTRVLSVPLSSLSMNPQQPRVEFDEEKIREMSDSIRMHGVLQPVLVRVAGEGRYQLVAGERRVRAARLAGLVEVPALEVSLSDGEMLEVALIENLQRDDLNPIEEARAYDYLCRNLGFSHDEVARRVGRNRTTVVNTLRLLRLPLPVKLDLQAKKITAGHARALLALDSEEEILALHAEVVRKGLSVRQVEERVQQRLGSGGMVVAHRKRRAGTDVAPEVEDLQNRLTEAVGVRVRLRPRSDTSGVVEITYSNLDELDRVCERMGLSPDGA